MVGPAGAGAVESISLAERLVRLRTSLIARPGFQRWAARFPLTRGLVRRRSRALFDLCAGFVYSQILGACVQLEIFPFLAKGPQTLGAIAARTQLSPEAARRLLKSAAAIRLLRELPGDRFALDDFGAAVIGTPGPLGDDRASRTAVRGPPRSRCAFTDRGRRAALAILGLFDDGRAGQAAYSELMAASQAFVAEDVLDAYAFPGRTKLMDVGGGEGVFLRAVSRRAPHLQLVLFDLAAGRGPRAGGLCDG